MGIHVKVEEAKGKALYYTDQFFKFPIKLYLKGNQDMKERLGIDTDDDDEQDFVVSTVSCIPDDIRSWYDSFSAPRSLDEVREDGFDITHVIMSNGDDYQCTWPVGKFEEKLNNHAHVVADRVANFVADSVAKALKEQKLDSQKPPPQSYLLNDKKPSWWDKFLNMFKKKKKKITY